MIRGKEIDRIWSEAILKFYSMMSFHGIDRCIAAQVQLVAKIFTEFINIFIYYFISNIFPMLAKLFSQN